MRAIVNHVGFDLPSTVARTAGFRPGSYLIVYLLLIAVIAATPNRPTEARPSLIWLLPLLFQAFCHPSGRLSAVQRAADLRRQRLRLLLAARARLHWVGTLNVCSMESSFTFLRVVAEENGGPNCCGSTLPPQAINLFGATVRRTQHPSGR